MINLPVALLKEVASFLFFPLTKKVSGRKNSLKPIGITNVIL